MEKIARDLAAQGYSITSDFFSTDFLEELREDLIRQHRAGLFTRAGLGADKGIHDDIRRDEILWIEQNSAQSTQRKLIDRLEVLRLEFNRRLFLALRTFEFHYAVYSAGGFYAKHVDALRQSNSRKISLILYLNPQWEESHGGQLRIYQGDTTIDIPPTQGTLVCFASDEIEHEVTLSHAPRMSVTGWFRN